MLTQWISKEALAELNKGFVVAIMLEAKEGEEEAVAEIARQLTGPTMAEAGVKLFLPYRSQTQSALFFIFELYADEAAWKAHEASDHFQRLIPQLVAKVKRRERVPFVPFL